MGSSVKSISICAGGAAHQTRIHTGSLARRRGGRRGGVADRRPPTGGATPCPILLPPRECRRRRLQRSGFSHHTQSARPSLVIRTGKMKVWRRSLSERMSCGESACAAAAARRAEARVSAACVDRPEGLPFWRKLIRIAPDLARGLLTVPPRPPPLPRFDPCVNVLRSHTQTRYALEAGGWRMSCDIQLVLDASRVSHQLTRRRRERRHLGSRDVEADRSVLGDWAWPSLIMLKVDVESFPTIANVCRRSSRPDQMRA